MLILATDDRSRVMIVTSPDFPASGFVAPTRIDGVWVDSGEVKSARFSAMDLSDNFAEVPDDEAVALNNEAKALLSITRHPVG